MGRTKNKPKIRSTQSQLRKPSPEAQKLPFISHIHELRKRLFFIAASVGVFAGIAYSAENQLTQWLLKPAAGQQFIYTTPGGGFDFLFKLCLYSGIAASIPVIVYQLFRYIHPLLREESRRFMLWCTLWSSVLAAAGITFGYFFGLPSAMHFLLQSFSSEQIKALITIQSYMSFVMVYLLGAALLFQIPLLLILINRIKPLQPRKLMQHQRWFIAGAFILGAIISPTPDIRNQLMLSGPIILMYEISILLIWGINRRKRKPAKVAELLRKDAEIQAARLAHFQQAQEALRQKLQVVRPALGQQNTVEGTNAFPLSGADMNPSSNRVVSERPHNYLQDFQRPHSYALPRSQVS